MFSLFSNNKMGDLSIVVDIQSSLVRGALYYEGNDGKKHIISVVTKSYLNKNTITKSEQLIKKNIKLISDVIEHLVKESQGMPILNINYILSSPWIFSKLKTVKVDYEKETKIDSDIISEIINDELKNETAVNGTKAIEQKIFEIKLNGYPTSAFEEKKAHLLEVSISTSFSMNNFLDKVQVAVSRHIHIKNHTFHSALLLQYEALREVLDDKSEFIYIHIHNELTDMIIVKNGLCKHISSFPFGIATLLRKMAQKSGESVESSDSLLSLFQGDKLINQEKIDTNNIVEPLINEWSDLFIKSFENIFDITNVPRSVYLSAHSHFDLFKQALALKNVFNFNIEPFDQIDFGDDIIFEKGSAKSNMIKMYVFALKKIS